MSKSYENIFVELALSPEGHVYLDTSSQSTEQLAQSEFEKISELFSKGSSVGVLHLGIRELSSLPPSFHFWQNFSRRFITQVCKLTSLDDSQGLPAIPAPPDVDLLQLINQASSMKGAEYLNSESLHSIWSSLHEALTKELNDYSGNVQSYLQQYSSRWNLVGRVCFHLAENKNDPDYPFAFLATYTTQLSQNAVAQHLPLRKALQDYAGEKNSSALLALLLPVQKAASQAVFIKQLVDSGAVFQAQKWTAHDAHRFLQEIPVMESSGIMVRVPNWWNGQKPPRPRVVVTVGESKASMLGLDTLLDFDMHLALGNGEKISREEWRSLFRSGSNLIKVKGQWVEVDREKLESVLSHWDNVQKGANNGLSMAESLRLLAGSGSTQVLDSDSDETEITSEWSTVIAGDWLKTVLDQLRNPNGGSDDQIEKILKKFLQATLRPYQRKGVSWLWLLYQLKLGGCLADDMGLGKTIQVLALLLIVKYHPDFKKSQRKRHLLVVPASLLGNWQREAARFAPLLKIFIAHASAGNSVKSSNIDEGILKDTDLVITTYAYVNRLEWLKNAEWDLLILDEAQLIKNPSAKQTRAVKGLKSQVRLTLTGTPIENRLSDLWSLFDFTSPGLLGSSKVFTSFTKGSGKKDSGQHMNFFSSLRTLTQPYILRRLKSDKTIISDLPDKTEMLTYCSLSKEQVQLYQHAITELTERLEVAQGIERRGIVLSYLLRFKQICNHPVQWLGYGEYSAEASGKFIRLREICEEIAAKQEKVLIFTQFREVIPAIAILLTQVFGREGLMLHGDTPIKKRAEMVERFQEELGPPFFVLSLKAGGTGLNLTRASHVIHFDRWWNPSVENQATDRAYRIGQKHPVLVHKFICSGTIEEKIEEMITAKKNLSQEILEGGGEVTLTELTNDELLKVISLDIQKALSD